MARSVLVPAAVEYPSSDGTPVAESDFQLTPVAYARDALRDHFRSRSDVYVAANLFIYYEEGNLEATVAPDVFVVLGAPNHDRHTYRLWQEPKTPNFVLEVTSRRTWREDQGRKRTLYRALGVAEYWQYDPTGDYLQPPLQGLRQHGAADSFVITVNQTEAPRTRGRCHVAEVPEPCTTTRTTNARSLPRSWSITCRMSTPLRQFKLTLAGWRHRVVR